MRRRRSLGTIYTEVEVDIAEMMEHLDDCDLLEELQYRATDITLLQQYGFTYHDDKPESSIDEHVRIVRDARKIKPVPDSTAPIELKELK